MRVLTWVLLAVVAGLYIVQPIQDPDLWWHIVVGRSVIAQHAVPHVDSWTMFGQGQVWRAYSWLFDVVVAYFDHHYQILGLLGLKLALAAALGFVFFWTYNRISADYRFAGLMGAFVLVSCFNHYTLRPQAIIWGIFALLMAVADLVAHEGLTVRRGLALALLMVLWANIHLSSILGLILIVGWIAKPGRYNTAFKAAACALIGTLITPYFGAEWLTFFETSSHPFQHAAIAEFQPATLLQYSTGFLVAIGLLLNIFFMRLPNRVPLARLAVGGVFALAGLAVVKFLPFAMIVLGGIAASYWSDCDSRRAFPLAEGIDRLVAAIERIPAQGLAFVLIAFGIVFVNRNWKEPINLTVVPVDALNFMLDKNLPHPFLNPFGAGGYVMYRLSDASGKIAYPVSIDGRTNLISKELWQEHQDAFLGQLNWKKFISRINPQTIIWRNDSALNAILISGGEWCHVFPEEMVDFGYSVYLSRAAWAERRNEMKSQNCS